MCVLAAGLCGSDAIAQTPRALPDGYRVEPGTRLLGAPFPSYIIDRPGTEQSGWSAILDVTGPAGPVYDAYVLQARQHGFDLPFSDTACRARGNPTEIQCEAGAGGTSASFQIDLRVCADCTAPYSTLAISASDASDRAAVAIPGMAPAPDPRFAVQLTSAQRGAARMALPRRGEPLGAKSRLTLLSGTRALMSTDPGCPDGSNLAVLTVSGDGKAVFDRYVQRLRTIPQESPVRTMTKVVDGRRVRQAWSGWETLNLVEGNSSKAALVVSECSD